MIPGDLMVFFGILFAALSVMDVKQDTNLKWTDKVTPQHSKAAERKNLD